MVVTIFWQESKKSAHKTLEAFWVEFNISEMNRKNKYLTMIRYLASDLKQLF